jgi:hypothetical protein
MYSNWYIFVCSSTPNLLAANQRNTHKYIPTAVPTVPPDDWQKKCSKHVEDINRNKLKVISVSSWSCCTDTL